MRYALIYKRKKVMPIGMVDKLTNFSSFILYLIIFSAFSCNPKPCDKIDDNFRSHIVTHHHKSKVYYYYHITPCSNCMGIDDDINGDGYSHDEPSDFVTFQDNKQVIYGRRYPKVNRCEKKCCHVFFNKYCQPCKEYRDK